MKTKENSYDPELTEPDDYTDDKQEEAGEDMLGEEFRSYFHSFDAAAYPEPAIAIKEEEDEWN